MALYFADSSALLKRYRNESGSSRVLDLLENAERVFVSRLAAVEVSSALVRRARAAQLPSQDLAAALAFLDADLANSLDIVELHRPLMNMAMVTARTHGLRGADAIQLASALFAQRETAGEQLILLSSDDELNAVAAAEGLKVENPILHP